MYLTQHRNLKDMPHNHQFIVHKMPLVIILPFSVQIIHAFFTNCKLKFKYQLGCLKVKLIMVHAT